MFTFFVSDSYLIRKTKKKTMKWVMDRQTSNEN